MKRRTYNNMLKATKMIVAKGYSWEEANKIAMRCFDNLEANKNGMEVEWYIQKVINKDDR